jgi:2-haloacid dehalogenase
LNKYKLILLDADETLFDFKRAENFALSSGLAQYGLELDEAIFEKYAGINKALWARLEKGEIDQDFLKRERFRQLFLALDAKIDAAEFSASYVEWLSRGSFLLENAEDICDYLHRKYKLALITNGIREVQLPRFANSKIAKDIDHIIVSEDARSSKPNVGIFDYACSKIGFYEKESMIIVGDSLSSDIQGGLNFGIDTCWLNAKSAKNDSAIKPTFEIRALFDLKDIL